MFSTTGKSSDSNPRPYRVSFAPKSLSVSKPQITPDLPQFKSTKSIKPSTDSVSFPNSLSIPVKRAPDPLGYTNEKRQKPCNDTQTLIDSVSKDVEVYCSLDTQKSTVMEIRKLMEKEGWEEAEMVRKVEETGRKLREVEVRVAEEALSLLPLLSLNFEWSLQMTLSNLPANPS